MYVPNASGFSKNRVSKNRAFDSLKWSLKSHLEIHKSTNWIWMENQGCFSKDSRMQIWKMQRQRIFSLLQWHWLDTNILCLSKKRRDLKDKWGKQLGTGTAHRFPPPWTCSSARWTTCTNSQKHNHTFCIRVISI